MNPIRLKFGLLLLFLLLNNLTSFHLDKLEVRVEFLILILHCRMNIEVFTRDNIKLVTIVTFIDFNLQQPAFQ